MSLTAERKIADSLRLGDGRSLSLKRTLVMGVVNVTTDSFSDGGSFIDPADAVAHALEMVNQGADIIDIGGESSRPGAEPISASDEMDRVLPVIRHVRQESKVVISIDTCKAVVARAAIRSGADIVNDISSLHHDPEMARLVAEKGVPVILMHMLGTPATMQDDPQYDDCVREIGEFFKERVEWCGQRGIDRSRIIIDPGIGFGKRLADNLDILSRLSEFRKLGFPLLIGTSRKSFIGKIHDNGRPPRARLGGSIASMLLAVMNGADIVRVHDVAETVEALKVLWALRDDK